jgi:hypothetical protein
VATFGLRSMRRPSAVVVIMRLVHVRAMKRATSVAFAILLSGGVAAAQGDQVPAQSKPDDEQATVTWSPVHLALPVVELEGEYRVAPHIGVGVIAGIGRVSDSSDMVTATAYEIGGQFNYYFMKPFSGLHGGVEALYLTVGDVAQDSSVTADGLSVGGFVGYKLLTSFGFTFVAQGGIAYLAVNAESSSAMVNEKKVYPLINLNIGWSF